MTATATTFNNLNLFFTQRYDYLQECAFNSLKLIRKPQLKNELVTEAYIWLTANLIKLQDKINSNQLESVIVHWMHRQVIWGKTQFKRKWIYNQKDNPVSEFDLSESYELMDNSMDEEDLLQTEKDFQDKIDLIYYNLHQLPMDKRILFDLVYNQGLNKGTKLQKYFKENVPMQPAGVRECRKLIKELEQELKRPKK